MTRPPGVQGIVETILHVDDLPRAVAFYRDEIGLEPMAGDPDGHLVEFITPGIWPNY